MEFTYQTRGTCSRQINFEMDEEHRVHNVSFVGGCNGNLQAVSRLVEGMTAEQIGAILGGINCGGKGTSCADQLSIAVAKAEEML